MSSKKRRSIDFPLPKAKRQALRNILLPDSGDGFGFTRATQSNTHAEFRYNKKISAQHFQQYAKIAPSIQHLDLTGCYSLSADALLEVTKLWGHSLKALNLEFCSTLAQTIHLSVPSTSYLLLQKLSLANTPVTDLGVRFFAARAPDLVDIILQGCSNITDISMSAIAQFCKQVRVLNLSNCDKITNYSVQIIAQEVASHLQELNLNECRQITGCVLDYLAYYCPNIKKLYLRDTSICGSEVASLCDAWSLTELNIHGLNISDSDLISITASQPHLEILDVSFCNNVTESGLREILSQNKNLHEIRAYGKSVSFSEEELSDVTVYS